MSVFKIPFPYEPGQPRKIPIGGKMPELSPDLDRACADLTTFGPEVWRAQKRYFPDMAWAFAQHVAKLKAAELEAAEAARRAKAAGRRIDLS